MKRKPLTDAERIKLMLVRADLSNKMLAAGFAEDDAAAAALCHNEALRKVLQERKQAGSDKDAAATADAFARPDLDDLIRGALRRREQIKDYIGSWVSEFGVSRSTIYRRIKKLTSK